MKKFSLLLLSLVFILCSSSIVIHGWFTLRHSIYINVSEINEPYLVDLLYLKESIMPLSTEEINAVIPSTFASFYESQLNGVKDEDGYVSARLYPSDSYLFSTNTSNGETLISIINSGTSNYKIIVVLESEIHQKTPILTQEKANVTIELGGTDYTFFQFDPIGITIEVPFGSALEPLPKFVILLLFIVLILLFRIGLFLLFRYHFSKLSLRSFIIQLFYSSLFAGIILYTDTFSSTINMILFFLLFATFVFVDLLLSIPWLKNRPPFFSTTYSFLTSVGMYIGLLFLIPYN